MTTVTRKLFGGAITADIRESAVDASTIRQVPDTQEVFLYPEDISIIIEVLQGVEAQDSSDVAKIHFNALAHDNEAQGNEVHDISVLSNDRGDETPSPIVLSGWQLISKFNEQTIDKVEILMGIFRVENKHVDLVVTMNVPLTTDNSGAVGTSRWTAAKADFDEVVTSLRIADFGLFA